MKKLLVLAEVSTIQAAGNATAHNLALSMSSLPNLLPKYETIPSELPLTREAGAKAARICRSVDFSGEMTSAIEEENA